MFNLKQSIHEWRQGIGATGRLEDGETEELESHLRDAIDSLTQQGLTEEQAFARALRELGSAQSLGAEHWRNHERTHWRILRTFFPGLMVNYIISTIRGLKRNETYNWINIFGLAIGLTACLFITYYTLFELSYDKSYQHRLVYRITNEHMSSAGALDRDAGGPVPLGPAVKNEFPEVVDVVRFWRAYQPTLRYQTAIFQEQKFMYADAHALRMFGLELVSGNPDKALTSPGTVIVSENMGKKYFGADDPIGKTLEYDGYPGNKRSFLVTGVFRNLPVNTHFDFDFLAAFPTDTENASAGWGSFKSLWTYVELNSSNGAAQLEQKFPSLVQKFLSDRRTEGGTLSFHLEPVSSIYLHSDCTGSMKAGGNLSLIRILMLIGLLILLTSCSNFINISLAKAMARMKESGIRKVLGASRAQVLLQYITEVLLSLGLALLMAVVLGWLLLPIFSRITQIEWQMSFLKTWQFPVAVIGLVLFVAALTGMVPALLVWKRSVVDSFRQHAAPAGNSMFGAKRIVVAFQFVISTALVMSLLIVNDQLTFIRRQDPGVKLSGVVAFPFSEKPDVFENRILALHGIVSVAYSQRLPVNTLNYDGRIVNISGHADPIEVESSFISPSFLETYSIQLLSGRNLDAKLMSDSNKFIINETAVKAFGWTLKNAIGQRMKWSGYLDGEVIGVVNDFQLESTHTKIQPMVMLDAIQKDSFMRNYISIRLSEGDHAETLEEIRRIWQELNPEGAFFYVPMTESYAGLHRSDLTFGEIVFYFTLMAIFISAVGLYATASLSAERMKKEIGVRKVLGSSVVGLLYLLAAPFFLTASAVILLIAPLVVWLMSQWLTTFVYHVPVQWTSLAFGSGVILVITLLSTLQVTLRAALINPVKCLRNE